jgi:hypothetical protein
MYLGVPLYATGPDCNQRSLVTEYPSLPLSLPREGGREGGREGLVSLQLLEYAAAIGVDVTVFLRLTNDPAGKLLVKCK